MQTNAKNTANNAFTLNTSSVSIFAMAHPQTPQYHPQEIRLGADKRTLTIRFAAETYSLTAEFLRVQSPSAEVRGHGGPMRIIGGKRAVTITALEPVGLYALKITFSDGHASGIYTWDFLHELGCDQFTLWEDYTAALAAKGLSRDGGSL